MGKVASFEIIFHSVSKKKFVKITSDKLGRLRTKMSPVVLKRRSQAADDGSALLYSL